MTGLSPKTTSMDLRDYLSSADITAIRCHRLKTRFQTYASFYLSLDVDDFNRLQDPSFWPADCLVKPFRGIFRTELVHASEISSGDGGTAA